MSDTTRATTFDDLGSDLRIFSTATNQFVYRYVDVDRNQSMLAVPGQVVDLGDWSAAQTIIRGSGPEQIFVRGDLLFVSAAALRQGRSLPYRPRRDGSLEDPDSGRL